MKPPAPPTWAAVVGDRQHWVVARFPAERVGQPVGDHFQAVFAAAEGGLASAPKALGVTRIRQHDLRRRFIAIQPNERLHRLFSLQRSLRAAVRRHRVISSENRKFFRHLPPLAPLFPRSRLAYRLPVWVGEFRCEAPGGGTFRRHGAARHHCCEVLPGRARYDRVGTRWPRLRRRSTWTSSSGTIGFTT